MESAGDFPHAPDPDTGTPEPADDRALAPDETPELSAPSVETKAATPTPSEITYVVQPGDTLYEIAQRFGISLADLIVANNIQNPRRLEIGQLLNITHPDSSAPATAAAPQASGNSYVVQRGDTLYHIARNFGITVQALIEANSLANPNRIMTGQTLTIPGTAAKSPPESTPEPQPESQPAPSPTQPSTVETLQPPVGDTRFAWPISLRDGWIAKWYRPEHPGIDIILPEGTPIRSAPPQPAPSSFPAGIVMVSAIWWSSITATAIAHSTHTRASASLPLARPWPRATSSALWAAPVTPRTCTCTSRFDEATLPSIPATSWRTVASRSYRCKE